MTATPDTPEPLGDAGTNHLVLDTTCTAYLDSNYIATEVVRHDGSRQCVVLDLRLLAPNPLDGITRAAAERVPDFAAAAPPAIDAEGRGPWRRRIGTLLRVWAARIDPQQET